MFHSLQDAVDASTSFDVLQVRGVCIGSTFIGQNLFIQGKRTSSGPAVLDGGGVGRVLLVSSGYTVGIRGIKVRHGVGDFGGGGIWNAGHLRLTNVVVRGNTAVSGGGIWNQGRLALKGTTTVRKNKALGVGTGSGGGIMVISGVLTMYDTSSVYGNTATYKGGGIGSSGGRITMNGASSVFGNVSGADGGGLGLYSGHLTMNGSSSIHDNQAGTSGGGVSSDCSVLVGVSDGGNVVNNTPDNVYSYSSTC